MADSNLPFFIAMNYKETIEWMFRQLPMYQTQGASAYKKDLTNTLLLATHLNNPEKNIRAIHVAGTNGKGSVSNMLASVYQEAGYKVGLYTSPHLKDYRERIKINGQDIPESYVCQFINANKDFFEANNLSFFEMTVGLAFGYFASEKVDIAIIETGMGGRLDSTNIITPLVSVITNIGLDHTQFLGSTLQAIAIEKAGIIKPHVPVVIGEYDEVTRPVFIDKAKQANSAIYFASDVDFPHYQSSLKGDYQKQNVKTVLQTIAILQDKYAVDKNLIAKGLLNIGENTNFKGRWQQLKSNPLVICDTAHNSHGLKIVVNQIAKQPYNILRIVFGAVNDKDLTDILPLLPVNAVYYFCRPNIPRGLEAIQLQQQAAAYSLYGQVYSSVTVAYETALAEADSNDFIYIGGSTFVVAEIL